MPLDNDGVIKLVKFGLPDDFIIFTINGRRPKYSLGLEGVLALKDAGVSDRVILAMSQRSIAEDALHTARSAK